MEHDPFFIIEYCLLGFFEVSNRVDQLYDIEIAHESALSLVELEVDCGLLILNALL